MMDFAALFNEMHPGFFERPSIQNIPAGKVYSEMLLDLRGGPVSAPRCEGDIRFGVYTGDLDALRALVGQVDAGWPPLFTGADEVYCAFDGDRVASFCLLEDMGRHMGGAFAGPGCVGTVPAWRRRGIGLEMVANATNILRERGYDYSYIHYTGVADWYARLGYRTVLRWDGRGIL